MLVLTRKRNEGLVFDDGRVRIRILDVVGMRVKLGVEASQDVQVLRDELMRPHQDPVPHDATR